MEDILIRYGVKSDRKDFVTLSESFIITLIIPLFHLLVLTLDCSGDLPVHDTCLFAGLSTSHTDSVVVELVLFHSKGCWHRGLIIWNGLCLPCRVPAKLLGFCLSFCRWFTLLSGRTQLWLNQAVKTWIFTPFAVWFLDATLSIPLSCLSVSNVTEDYNIRCWRPASYPDSHQWLASHQRQQCGPALQTARYDWLLSLSHF